MESAKGKLEFGTGGSPDEVEALKLELEVERLELEQLMLEEALGVDLEMEMANQVILELRREQHKSLLNSSISASSAVAPSPSFQGIVGIFIPTLFGGGP